MLKCRLLDDEACVVGEPLGVAGNTGETGRNTDFAAARRAETDHSDLVESAIGLDETQRTARITLQKFKLKIWNQNVLKWTHIARAFASGCGNAENVIRYSQTDVTQTALSACDSLNDNFA